MKNRGKAKIVMLNNIIHTTSVGFLKKICIPKTRTMQKIFPVHKLKIFTDAKHNDCNVIMR